MEVAHILCFFFIIRSPLLIEMDIVSLHKADG